MRLSKAVCLLAVLVIAWVPMALAQGTYTQIDVPGATLSACTGINSAGDIVGLYFDSSSNYHGFILSGGVYTTIDYPGSNTSLVSINDVGQILGNAGGGVFGFLYDVQTQTFAEIIRPHASFTYVSGINNAGTITGVASGTDGQTHGFELRGSQYHDVVPPNSPHGSWLTGVAASGKAVGYATDKVKVANFLYRSGKYKHLPIPNAPSAIVDGINPAGNALAGYYVPPTGGSVGFVYANNTLQTLQFPGLTRTYAYGINASGEVVGYFYDSQSHLHGFIWTPPADASTKK